jgi:hypothetical protein
MLNGGCNVFSTLEGWRLHFQAEGRLYVPRFPWLTILDAHFSLLFSLCHHHFVSTSSNCLFSLLSLRNCFHHRTLTPYDHMPQPFQPLFMYYQIKSVILCLVLILETRHYMYLGPAIRFRMGCVQLQVDDIGRESVSL